MSSKRSVPWQTVPAMLVVLALAACSQSAPPAEKVAPAKPTAAAPAAAPEKPAAKEAAPAAKEAAPAAKDAPKPAPNAGIDAEVQKLLDAAKAEGGTLSVITHPATQYSGWVKAFQARFPDIKLEHLGMRPSEVTPRLLAEQKNGVFNFDVYVAPTSNTVKSLSPAGVFQDITPFIVIPDLRQDSLWHGGFNQYAEKDQKFSLITAMTLNRATMINRALVPATAVKTIDDLIKPEWKGKISIYDPRTAANGSLSLANVLRDRDETLVRQIMENSVFVDSSPQVLDFAASGRYPIGIGADVDTLLKMQAEGAAKDIEVSDLTAFHAGAGIAVFTNAPHPAASRLLVNWFLTQEGQDSYAREGGSASRRVDVKSYTGDTPAYATPDWSNLDKYVRPNEWSGIPFVDKVNEMAKEIKR